YYSKDNGATWVNSTSSSYTFTGLSVNTTYNFKVYVKDTAGHSSSQKSISGTTENPITLAKVCSNGDYLADCVKTFYSTYGEGTDGLYYHNGSGSYTNADQEAGDNSYRYTGANPNNYVCFGSDAATCPGANLHRIIGVFGDQVKLIKTKSYGNYAWDAELDNTWSSSDIKSTLNSTYLNSLGSTWSSKIAMHSWQVGGMARNTSYTAKQYYNTEVGSSSSGTTDSMKIGLMYVSDYGYATSPSNWTTALEDYDGTNVKNNNWLYLGSTEWTISRRTDGSDYVFIVDRTGYVFNNYGSYGFVTRALVVRPSFYLNPDVTYVSGTGTQTDPYRIS
ncbi:MAG TPA: fibronectin type III domain-containing protein, partial [Candidatus Onthocola stercoravium]|nr:fibronectin type III domain-containing protein [Candidatus Onthocola stercoravium]